MVRQRFLGSVRMSRAGLLRLAVLALATVLMTGAMVLAPSRGVRGVVAQPWTVASPVTPTGQWDAVAYGAGRWVVLGTPDAEATSTNATSWGERGLPGGSWGAVIYAAGRFVALSSSSPQEMTSTNGLSWSARSAPGAPWVSLAYGDGRYVAVSSSGLIAMSTNASTWSITFSRRFDHFAGVAYGNGRFVVVDSLHGDSLESSDGVHWAFYPAQFPAERWGGVAYGNGNFVAADGSATGMFATTDLGYLWAARTYRPAQDIDDVAFGCNAFVAVGHSPSSTDDILTSPTGATWSAVSVPTDATGTWTAVGYGGNRYVAVDNAGDIAWAKAVGPCGATIPAPPQQVSGVIRNGGVWTYMHPPASSGGAVVNDYLVTVTGNGVTKTCKARVYFEPNCIIQGLKNRLVYDVVAQSHNRFGYSADSDPYFVIPVASWTFAVTSPVPVVLLGAKIPVQVTGIQANSEGIFPVTTVTVDVGSQRETCRPSPFGECLFSIPTAHAGVVSLAGSYSGYGRYYAARASHVWVASVTPSATSVSPGQRITVTVAGGPPGAPVHLSVGAKTALGRLGGSGGGSATIAAPTSTGAFTLTVEVDGVVLDPIAVVVRS